MTLQAQLDPVIEVLLEAVEGKSTRESLEYWDNWLAANNEYNQVAVASSD